MEAKIYSVSEVNGYIKAQMDRDGLLAGLCIRGEISNYKVYPSGHHYFSLKDSGGAIRCVLFRGAASGAAVPPGERDAGAGHRARHCLSPGRGVSALLRAADARGRGRPLCGL